MYPYLTAQGLWMFDEWAEYYNIPCTNLLDNLNIMVWLRSETELADKNIKLHQVNWKTMALRYKKYLRRTLQAEQQKQQMSEIFGTWRRRTASCQMRETRRLGIACAKMAAARARSSTESEMFLSLI